MRFYILQQFIADYSKAFYNKLHNVTYYNFTKLCKKWGVYTWFLQFNTTNYKLSKHYKLKGETKIMLSNRVNPIYFESHLIGAEHLDLQQCVLQYQKSKNDYLLHVILYKLRDILKYFLYIRTNYEDKHELIALYEDKLLQCLETYREDGSASFRTYYSRCLNNELMNLVRTQTVQTWSLDYCYEDNEGLTTDLVSMYDQSEVCNDYDDVETDLLLSELQPKLDDNEYKVCKVILTENHTLTQTEIAKEIGLTVTAIKNIYNRLQKKLVGYNVAYRKI